MRYPIFGVVAPSTSITVFNEDGVTPATIYAAASGGAALAGGVVTANDEGKVFFFVDDADYPFPSYFEILSGGNTLQGVWSGFSTVKLNQAG